jgi:hypothetical protein
MLAVVTSCVLAAFGATAHALQPSALRVTVTAVVALLAPLYWPGCAGAPTRTALRIALWSAAAAGIAAIALLALGNPAQTGAQILEACAMLMLILLVTHAVAAGLERLLAQRHGSALDVQSAREIAGRSAAMALALMALLPLWLGPVAELLAGRATWTIDAVVGVSPLTHLAIASGNDLLRNLWFYQHTNLAALQFSYPSLATIGLSYASVCLVLLFFLLASARPRRSIDGVSPIPAAKE